MGVKFLQELVDNDGVIPNSVVPVDLIKLAKNYIQSVLPQQRKPGVSPKFSLVVDGESCLNRLYGGFYADWVCGGQWNRMVSFLEKLITVAENANIELVVFFNGAVEPQRMNEWVAQQKEDYKKVNQILSHINRKGTPPPKAWWIPPIGLRMALRMILRQKNIDVVSTMDDHRQEVIAYCRENKFHGLIADDAEYIAFDPPRLFSASRIKLTFKDTLESKEYLISVIMKSLELTNEKLCVLTALLGNYLLPDTDLKDVYKAAKIDALTENTAEVMVKKLAKYLNDINVSNDLDEIVLQIFGSDSDPRGPALKQSIQYYLDGTKDGFLKYRSISSGKRCKTEEKASASVEGTDISQEPDLDTTKLASENVTTEKSLLNTYKEAQSCLNNGQEENKDGSDTSSTNLNANCDSSSNSDPSDSLKKAKIKKDKVPVLPPVPHEVMRTVSERHNKGLMSPYIYQILSQGEIKLPVVLEDGKEIPNIYSFYKPIRQMVYAIVFNLHHHKYMASKNNTPLEIDIRVKEWIFNKSAQCHKPEYVKAEPVGWRVPTIQRLWFGTTQDDKRRRLRAFLTCMRSDVQLLLNPEFVPQQLLVAAVVLRYMMSFPEKQILRKPELDAFIVASLCPEFADNAYTQNLQLSQLSSRGIQLAAMFMKGIEMAMLVNDACGAPVPWLMCCPWLFFDGKFFHQMYQKATTVKNLHELCDNKLGLVMRAERMRQAILEGLNVQFARPPMPALIPPNEDLKSYPRPSYLNRVRMGPPTLPAPSGMGRPMAAGRGRRSLGGRLEIAGVVVGSWGANYNLSQPSYESPAYMLPPQVAAVGTYNNFVGYRPRAGFIPRPKGKNFKAPYGKKKTAKKEKKAGKGRGFAVGSSSSGNSTLVNEISPENKQNGSENKSSSDSNLVNGDGDLNLNDGRFDDAVLNGAIGFIGDGDAAKGVKTIHDAASPLVGAVSK